MIVLQGERERVEVVRFSPDGTALVAPTYRGLQVWQGLPNPGPPELVTEHRYTRTAEFTADGSRLFVDGSGFAVRDLAARASRPIILWGEAGCEFDLSLDGRFLVVGQNHRRKAATLARRPVDDLAPGATVWKVPLDYHLDSRPVFVGPDRFVAYHAYRDASDRPVYRYVTRDAGTGAAVGEADGPYMECGRNLLVADQGGRFLAAVRGAQVFVLDAPDPGRGVAVLKGGRKHVTGLAFHPSGRHLATTSNDETVRFWDTASWTCATAFEWGAGRMRSIAFSPDGALAAAGTDDGRVVIWDVDL